jgi:hypothetical protein
VVKNTAPSNDPQLVKLLEKAQDPGARGSCIQLPGSSGADSREPGVGKTAPPCARPAWLDPAGAWWSPCHSLEDRLVKQEYGGLNGPGLWFAWRMTSTRPQPVRPIPNGRQTACREWCIGGIEMRAI